jgi:DNA-binding NarL/FixJ family response regulator
VTVRWGQVSQRWAEQPKDVTVDFPLRTVVIKAHQDPEANRQQQDAICTRYLRLTAHVRELVIRQGEIVELYEQGLSITLIARRVRYSRKAIYRALTRAGVDYRVPRA